VCNLLRNTSARVSSGTRSRKNRAPAVICGARLYCATCFPNNTVSVSMSREPMDLGGNERDGHGGIDGQVELRSDRDTNAIFRSTSLFNP